MLFDKFLSMFKRKNERSEKQFNEIDNIEALRQEELWKMALSKRSNEKENGQMFEFKIVINDDSLNSEEYTPKVDIWADEMQKTVTQAETLPNGWVWEGWKDGSGHLLSPEKESYFSYDLQTSEVIMGRDDIEKYYDSFYFEKGRGLSYNINIIHKAGELWVNKNVLNNSIEIIKGEDEIISDENEQYSYSDNGPSL